MSNVQRSIYLLGLLLVIASLAQAGIKGTGIALEVCPAYPARVLAVVIASSVDLTHTMRLAKDLALYRG